MSDTPQDHRRRGDRPTPPAPQPNYHIVGDVPQGLPPRASLPERAGTALAVAAGAAIAAPILAVAVGLSWRLFTWIAGV